MPSEAELKRWVLEKTFERLGPETTGSLYAGNEGYDANGFDGVKKGLFSNLLVDLYESQDNEGSPARGFNALAGDWPKEMRSVLAGFEYRDPQNDELGLMDDDYEKELQFLAKQYDALEMSFEQTELSCFYEDNPFEDERLSEEEARVVLLLRTTDESISTDIVEDVSDFESFKRRLEETNDVEEAISAHLYGDELPVEVTNRLPAPSEWPDELDPRDVEEEICEICSNAFYEVYSEREQIEYVIGDGSPYDVFEVTHDDESEYYPCFQEDENGVICDRCAVNIADELVEWIRVGDGNLTCVKWGRGIYKDRAARSDVYTPFRTARSDSLFERIVQNGLGSVSDEVVTIEPNPAVSERTAQQNLLAQIRAGDVEEVIDENTFYIKHNHHPIQGHTWQVIVRRTDLESARKVKSMLESPGEFIEA